MSANATTIEGAIITLLNADAGVTALIAGRIQPIGDPSSVSFPKVTYQRINTIRSADVGAFSNDGPTGMALARIQFDVFATSLLTAKQIASAIRKVLNGFAGTVAGVVIGFMQSIDERELPATLYPGQGKPVQRYMIEIRVSFTDV